MKLVPRNPERIQVMLHLVETIWKIAPDMRLGQLLGNAKLGDLYNVEDDVDRILEALRANRALLA